MKYCDFAVKYDPEKDTKEDVTKRILYVLFIKRLKYKKPAVAFISGDSGEGKSWTNVRLQEILMEIQGVDIKPYFKMMNVVNPMQYPEKLNTLLYDKEYKKANLICMHEAREVVKAKNWQSFLTQSVADVNALSRRIKRMVIIIISQFIRDVTTDIRYTMNYYCKVKRVGTKKARLYINVMWKDDRDLEKPKLRRRKLGGYLILPNGKYRPFVPQYFEMNRPSQELIDIFETMDYESKSKIIKSKIHKLLEEMKKESGEQNIKVSKMVEWYIKNPENLNLIGKQKKKGYVLNSHFKDMHGLNDSEATEFKIMLQTALKEKGVIIEA